MCDIPIKTPYQCGACNNKFTHEEGEEFSKIGLPSYVTQKDEKHIIKMGEELDREGLRKYDYIIRHGEGEPLMGYIRKVPWCNQIFNMYICAKCRDKVREVLRLANKEQP